MDEVKRSASASRTTLREIQPAGALAGWEEGHITGGRTSPFGFLGMFIVRDIGSSDVPFMSRKPELVYIC